MPFCKREFEFEFYFVIVQPGMSHWLRHSALQQLSVLTLSVLEHRSTAPHAVVSTLVREHYYCVYPYMLCRLMY